MPLTLSLWTSRVPQPTYGSFLFILSLANSLKKEIEKCFSLAESIKRGSVTTKGGQDSGPCKSFSRTADPAADSHICNNIIFLKDNKLFKDNDKHTACTTNTHIQNAQLDVNIISLSTLYTL